MIGVAYVRKALACPLGSHAVELLYGTDLVEAAHWLDARSDEILMAELHLIAASLREADAER